MKSNSNMRDVAELARVSVATVSHVLNGTKAVSESTRLRVEECAKMLGYQIGGVVPLQNTSRKTRVIGVIVPDIAHSLLVSFFRAIKPELYRRGYEVLLASSEESLEQEKRNLKMFTEGIVDGILISSVASEYTEVKKYFPEYFPIVFFDRIPGGCPHDAITINNYDAIYKGIEKLIYQNHSRIGCVTSKVDFPAKAQRECAYRDVLKKYGLKEYYGYHYVPQAQDIFSAVKELLGCGCTAIVSFNGRITEGIVNTLLKMDKKIGKEIEVLAYQDSAENEIYSLLTSTHIVQPVNELARTAAEQIAERLKNPSLPVRHTVLMSYLISDQNMKMY